MGFVMRDFFISYLKLHESCLLVIGYPGTLLTGQAP